MNPAEAVTILAIVASLAWWASLWLWPWKRCPRCGGRRKLTGPDGDVFRRCGRCGGTGEVRRWGAGKAE